MIDLYVYNIFKNEYSDFGFEGEVYYYIELLVVLVKEGKLILKYVVNEKIIFYDFCYLGRYNEVYSLLREILKVILGVSLIEMDCNCENGMCCGVGGGLMWMEEMIG